MPFATSTAMETPVKRKPGRPRKNKDSANDGNATSASKLEPAQARPTIEDGEDEGLTASSGSNGGRVRRKPRRYSDEMVDSQEKARTGILTPSKRKRQGPKKAVSFGLQDQKDLEAQLGFRDIPPDANSHLDPPSAPEADDVHDAVLSVRVAAPVDVLAFRRALEANDDQMEAPKRKRGRPRKTPLSAAELSAEAVPKVSEPELEEVPIDEQDLELADGSTNFRVLFWRMAQEHDLDGAVSLIREILLEKLAGKRRLRLIGLDEEWKRLHQLVEQTVVSGEGNSMLVMGARGSGKTTLVERVISDLSTEHREDFHVVRLNGFIHTDDKLALREIWRQLGREMEVEEDAVGKTSNYADTLSSLLALLSHPVEMSNVGPEQIAKSVIFVLDEFELFAAHPRQTLLYNLFDIAQARKAPVAVIGVTTKVNVVDSLEKRVKSRFSHRYVHLSLPKSLATFWDVCKQAITVAKEDLHSQSGSGPQKMAGEMERLVAAWNSSVDALWDQDVVFRNAAQSIHHRTRSVPDFLTSCLIPIANLAPATLFLTGSDFANSSLLPPESKLNLLPGLSELELTLLIAAARLEVILDSDACTFDMVYDEYCTLAARARAQSSASGAAAVGAGSRLWGRMVAVAAWERLVGYEFVVPAVGSVPNAGPGGASGAGGGAGSRDVGRLGRMFKVDVGLEEILPSVSGVGAVMAKWCREI